MPKTSINVPDDLYDWAVAAHPGKSFSRVVQEALQARRAAVDTDAPDAADQARELRTRARQVWAEGRDLGMIVAAEAPVWWMSQAARAGFDPERLVGYLRAHDAATARWVLRVLRNEEINDPEMPRPWAVLMARLFQIFTDPDGAVKIADDAGAGDLFRRGAAAGLREVWTAATRNL